MASQSATTTSPPLLPSMPNTASVLDTNMSTSIRSMKESLGNLDDLFDSISIQAAHVARDDGQSQTSKELDRLRKEMDGSDQRQKDKIEEVKALIENELQQEVMIYLESLIQAGVIAGIDEVVDKEVDAQFAALRPQAAQAELEKSRKDLKHAECLLHNGESRRLNRQLTTTKMDDQLHSLYTPRDTVSDAFPKTLKELCALDAMTAKQLLQDFGLKVSEHREENVSQFMQFCGVGYEMSRTSGGEITINKVL